MMFHWLMSSHLNSDTYHPLEYDGHMSSSIQNKTANKMLVTKVGISFDWKGKGFFCKDCNIEIAPEDKVNLPEIPFEIELEASIATHEYWAGVTYKLLTEKGWKLQGSGMNWCKQGNHLMVIKSPKRNFEVFISHSNASEDALLLEKTIDLFTSCGIDTYVAERIPQPGYPLWQKIEAAIRRADAILILWTQAGSQSGDIREEIGLAIGAKRTKRIIPIVEAALKTQGSLIGLEHVPLVIGNPLEALSTAISRAIKWADEEQGKSKIH